MATLGRAANPVYDRWKSRYVSAKIGEGTAVGKDRTGLIILRKRKEGDETRGELLKRSGRYHSFRCILRSLLVGKAQGDN